MPSPPRNPLDDLSWEERFVWAWRALLQMEQRAERAERWIAESGIRRGELVHPKMQFVLAEAGRHSRAAKAKRSVPRKRKVTSL